MTFDNLIGKNERETRFSGSEGTVKRCRIGGSGRVSGTCSHIRVGTPCNTCVPTHGYLKKKKKQKKNFEKIKGAVHMIVVRHSYSSMTPQGPDYGPQNVPKAFSILE